MDDFGKRVVAARGKYGWTRRELARRAQLHEHVRDAVRCHFEEGQQPKLIRLHFVREEVIAI